MSTIKSDIEKELLKIRKKYLDSADEINSDYNREKDTIDDYQGRQIFELLQNADDEACNTNGNVKIELLKDVFKISNTGIPFSFEGVKSLLRSNNSPKKVRSNTIGHKGLGFRSVLTWAKKININTHYFSLEFSIDIAKQFLDGLIKENPSLNEDLKKINTDTHPIAILACPKIKDNFPEKGYDTTIEITCTESTKENILGQIKQLNFEELLFLENIQTITVITDDYKKTFFKEKENGKTIIKVKDIVSGKVEVNGSWFIYEKKGKLSYNKQDYELKIAYDEESHLSGNVLYNYFKTEINISFPAIIHGTFELTTNRNQLKKNNPANHELVRILADFLISTAICISKKNKTCDYEPLKLLLTTEINSVLADDYGLKTYINEKVKKTKIFPTINREYISLNDPHAYHSSHFGDVLCKTTFSDLLLVCEDRCIESFIEQTSSFYEYEEFKKRLNDDIQNNKYDIEQKCKIMDLIRCMKEPNYAGQGIHILVDIKGKQIQTAVEVFPLPENEKIADFPDWVEIRFLHETMLSILKNNINGDIRDVVNEYKAFSLAEYSFNNLLRLISIQIEKTNDVKKIKDFLSWLFKYYIESDKQKIPNIESIRIPLICKDGKIRKSSECYFGKEFNNELGEKIVNIFNGPIITTEYFNSENIFELVAFYEWIGVLKYPRLETIGLNKQQSMEYIDYCFSNKDYLSSTWGEAFQKKDFWNGSVIQLSLERVEHFDEIIEKLDFTDLLAYFLSDEKLNLRLMNKFEYAHTSEMKCTPGQKRDTRIIPYSELPSYIQYCLSKKKWIECKGVINELKEAAHCCLEDLGLEPFFFQPVVNYEKLKKFHNISKSKIELLLYSLGVAKSFLEIPHSVIYEILLRLPQFDDPEKVKTKKIYSLLRTLKTEDLKRTDKYTQFIKTGEVLVKIDGRKEFISNTKAFYADRKEFSEEILKQFPMLDLPPRTGTLKVETLFGVKPLKDMNVRLEKDSTKTCTLNTSFIADYQQFIAYVLTCRHSTKNFKDDLRKLQKSKVSVDSEVSVLFTINNEEKRAVLKDCEIVYLRNKDKAVIKVPNIETDYSKLKSNIKFCDAVSEVIATIIDVEDDRIFYRDLFKSNEIDRNYMIRNDKGDVNLEILNSVKKQLRIEHSSKNEFWILILELCSKSYVDNISDEDISNELDIDINLIRDINYDDLNIDTNIPALLDIFKKLNIEISFYNEQTPNQIDFRPYWNSIFNKKREEYYEAYLWHLYELYKGTQDINTFEKLKKNFMNSIEIENSWNIDIEKLFTKNYNVTFAQLNKLNGKSILSILIDKKKNVDSAIIEKLTKRWDPAIIDDYILLNCIHELEQKEKTDESCKNIYNMSNDVSSLIRTSIITEVEIENIYNSDNNMSVNMHKHQKKHPTLYSEKLHTTKIINGWAGEQAVFNELKKSYQNIQWHSGNAQRAGVVLEGNDSLGYDMSYINKSGKEIFVEVKSSSSNSDIIEFIISQNELDFALAHRDCYVIYFVYLENGIAKIKDLGNIFSFDNGESWDNNSQYNIKASEYTIMAKIRKEESPIALS